jgi:hypothetical protein
MSRKLLKCIRRNINKNNFVANKRKFFENKNIKNFRSINTRGKFGSYIETDKPFFDKDFKDPIKNFIKHIHGYKYNYYLNDYNDDLQISRMIRNIDGGIIPEYIKDYEMNDFFILTYFAVLVDLPHGKDLLCKKLWYQLKEAMATFSIEWYKDDDKNNNNERQLFEDLTTHFIKSDHVEYARIIIQNTVYYNGKDEFVNGIIDEFFENDKLFDDNEIFYDYPKLFRFLTDGIIEQQTIYSYPFAYIENKYKYKDKDKENKKNLKLLKIVVFQGNKKLMQTTPSILFWKQYFEEVDQKIVKPPEIIYDKPGKIQEELMEIKEKPSKQYIETPTELEQQLGIEERIILSEDIYKTETT